MSMQRGRSTRGGGGGRGGQSGTPGMTGNLETGLFTAGGRDRFAGGSGGSGGPTRSSRTTRRGAHRGAASLPPRPHAGEDVDGDMKMGGEKSSSFGQAAALDQTPHLKAKEKELSSSLCPHQLAEKASEQTLAFTISCAERLHPSKLISQTNAQIKPPEQCHLSSLMLYKQRPFEDFLLIIKTTEDNKIMEDGPHKPVRVVQTTGTIDAVREFIRSRHQNGFLNLENMAQDDILRSAKIVPPGSSTGRSDVGVVMMKVAADLFPDITTISFASNGLRSLAPISSVAQFFPNILNLSFKGNEIRNYRDLENLSGTKKLPNLREIIFLDNPLRDRDIAKHKDDISYRRLFPSIQYLDQQPVGPKISFGLGDIVHGKSETVSLPAPIRGNFFDSPDTQAMVLEFLTTYFKLFDTNRTLLEHMYDSSATFSVSTNVTISPTQRSKGRGGDNWSEYSESARNLSRLKDLGDRTKRLHVGNQDIVKEGLMPLPETKHDLTDASKFSVDAWQTGSLLPAVCIYIMVHGEYEQAPVRGRGYTKSFDRSFIIAPAPPNSSAAQHGWKCLIISDQLTVRQYNGHEAWQSEPELNVPGAVSSAVTSAFNATGGAPPMANTANGTPAAAPPPATGVGPDPNQTPMQGISPEQHVKAQELQQLTGLNYPYSVQCLAAVGWDVQGGVALVNQERANIPVDAWQTPRF
ncbi:nuclear mRNA export, poly(A)+RNA binding protein [Podila clonocystis]|nr:nuclear mRNA export, poly(A)+RNA binding protein [Podila clonocystis]